MKNLKLIQSGGAPDTRLFDDLEAAFSKKLPHPKDVQDHTFKILGILASNGVNTFRFVPCQKPVARNTSLSNYNSNKRLDLAQSSAGAWYGAMSTSVGEKNLSRDQFEAGLRKIFEGAHSSLEDKNFVFPSTDHATEILSTYSTWKKTIDPDAVYEYFETQMNE